MELRRGQWSRSTGSEEAGSIDREPLEPDGSGVVEVFVAGSDDALAGEAAPPGGQLSRPLARGCVVAASLTLIIAMIAVAVTGFTSSTWTYSRHTMDREASARLANLADAMAAAGAPRAAVVHARRRSPVSTAARRSRRWARLCRFWPRRGRPHLVPLRRQLHRVFLEIYEKSTARRPLPSSGRPYRVSRHRTMTDWRTRILDRASSRWGRVGAGLSGPFFCWCSATHWCTHGPPSPRHHQPKSLPTGTGRWPGPAQPRWVIAHRVPGRRPRTAAGPTTVLLGDDDT
ncbi:MAG: hypothetical protein HZY76_15985 [Anaerolineae bacterium]|nr:MAG: hypothetical protein HZY76_15985 [Anaerolineae bacterium]